MFVRFVDLSLSIVSVLLVYPIFVIGWSIDPAPLSSCYSTHHGRELRFFGTLGSSLEVVLAKVLRPRPLGDKVYSIIRSRPVAIDWLVNQRH